MHHVPHPINQTLTFQNCCLFKILKRQSPCQKAVAHHPNSTDLQAQYQLPPTFDRKELQSLSVSCTQKMSRPTLQ